MSDIAAIARPPAAYLAEPGLPIHEPAELRVVALLYGADHVDFLFLVRETRLTKGRDSADWNA
jgi:hypothetical protein